MIDKKLKLKEHIDTLYIKFSHVILVLNMLVSIYL